MHLVQIKTFLRNKIVLKTWIMAVGMRRRHGGVPTAAGVIEFSYRLMSENPRFG